MLQFALIGERLGHSLSVPIHRALYRHLGLDAEYRLVEIPPEDFDTAVPALMKGLRGMNVTIPYKQRIMPLLDAVDERAGRIGAVNTVTIGQTTCGHNTDAAGVRALMERYGLLPGGLDCYCLGTGGSSHTVRTVLEEMGARSVTLVSRHPEAGEISYEQLSQVMDGGFLVNTTPAGMWPRVEGCPLTDDQLARVMPRCRGVVDIIFNPAETRLTAAAKAHGVPACTGLYMLIHQAVEAERLWLERDIPADMTDRIAGEITL